MAAAHLYMMEWPVRVVDKKKSLDKETLELLTCIMHLQLALGHTKELWEGQALRSNSDF